MEMKNGDPTTKTSFAMGYLFLLVSILSLLILSPLLREFLGIKVLSDIFITAILVTGVGAVSSSRNFLVIALSLALPMLASVWMRYFMAGLPQELYVKLALIGNCFGILFFGFLAKTILTHITGEKSVSSDLIYGAIVGYLLIAIIWSFLYLIVETLHAHSFNVPELFINEDIRNSFFYYSFVTITTLGYGDIVPLTPLARSLAILEAVVGQVYLAVLVARLVGIHIAQRMAE